MDQGRPCPRLHTGDRRTVTGEFGTVLGEVGQPHLLDAFRCRLPGRCPTEVDEATAELLRQVNAGARVFLSSTRIDGRYVGRISTLNHRTDRARVSEAVQAVCHHAAELAA